ncbi:MAG: triphosphoribosyl-dephospho-CoA synthase MdcB [Xanthomonadales bacterium]|nr:triphosphoribosyl-dephospho-CoA synthase MdcB [Xanthomonadales bacterium]
MDDMHDKPAWLAGLVGEALTAELDLTPKPGLIDRRGAGVHHDMDYTTMQASIRALHPGFLAIAEAGALPGDAVSLRARLGLLGREAEAAMLLATGGVNTHRGAIWCLGLLTAAAAARPAREWQAERLAADSARIAAIDDPGLDPTRVSNGKQAITRYGAAGARQIAAEGFRPVIEHALPVLQRVREATGCEQTARLDALAALMAVLDDTCVLHRAGPRGLAAMQAGARGVLAAGGTATPAGRAALADLDHTLTGYRASPGGAADLLAATVFIDRLTGRAAATATGETVHADAIV